MKVRRKKQPRRRSLGAVTLRSDGALLLHASTTRVWVGGTPPVLAGLPFAHELKLRSDVVLTVTSHAYGLDIECECDVKEGFHFHGRVRTTDFMNRFSSGQQYLRFPSAQAFINGRHAYTDIFTIDPAPEDRDRIAVWLDQMQTKHGSFGGWREVDPEERPGEPPHFVIEAKHFRFGSPQGFFYPANHNALTGHFFVRSGGVPTLFFTTAMEMNPGDLLSAMFPYVMGRAYSSPMRERVTVGFQLDHQKLMWLLRGESRGQATQFNYSLGRRPGNDPLDLVFTFDDAEREQLLVWLDDVMSQTGMQGLSGAEPLGAYRTVGPQSNPYVFIFDPGALTYVERGKRVETDGRVGVQVSARGRREGEFAINFAEGKVGFIHLREMQKYAQQGKVVTTEGDKQVFTIVEKDDREAFTVWLDKQEELMGRSLSGTPAEHATDFQHARQEMMDAINDATEAMKNGQCLVAGGRIDNGYVAYGRMQANAYEGHELAEAARLFKALKRADEPFEKRCVRPEPVSETQERTMRMLRPGLAGKR